MDVYTTEEQQVEDLKKWFKQYGNLIFWVVIALAAVILGWFYWQHHQQIINDKVSEDYMALLDAMDKNDDVTVLARQQDLMGQHPDSVYAQFAALMSASTALEKQDFDKAQQSLEWATQHGKTKEFRNLAKVRLMRLMMAQDKLKEALALYDEDSEQGFLSLMAELKGDILLKQGNQIDAKKAYLLALSAAPEEGMHGLLLKMKMNELGLESSDKPQAENEANQNEE